MLQFLTDLRMEIFGEIAIVIYVAYFIYVLFGVLLSSGLVAIKTRDKDSIKTPEKFSIIFLIQDNLVRIVCSLAVVFMIIRFGEHVLHVVPSYIGAIALGFSFDLLIIILEKIQQKARTVVSNMVDTVPDTLNKIN